MTAVEWLEKEFIKLESTIGVHGKMYELIEQAKQMETEQQQKIVDDALTNYELGWADRKASSQTEISEHRFTEKDIRFAYMQGYNRGVNGNPNHMESYIEHLKSTKSSQTEISDEEIREQGIKYDNQALSETPIAHFMEGAFWYREQLKQRKYDRSND